MPYNLYTRRTTLLIFVNQHLKKMWENELLKQLEIKNDLEQQERLVKEIKSCKKILNHACVTVLTLYQKLF